MKQEAEAHAAEDTAKKDRIEARNKADNMLYVAEKSLKDAGDKVKPEDKTVIDEKVKALRDILESGSKEDLEGKTSELSDAIQKIGAAMYGSGTQESQTPPSGTNPGADSEAKADEKKEEKKVEEGEVVS
jgi:molecular chaperone DnaK